jgi:hypothetical protein
VAFDATPKRRRLRFGEEKTRSEKNNNKALPEDRRFTIGLRSSVVVAMPSSTKAPIGAKTRPMEKETKEPKEAFFVALFARFQRLTSFQANTIDPRRGEGWQQNGEYGGYGQ